MLAILSSVARLTDTGVTIDLINTDAIILARVAVTVVDVGVTVAASPSRFTDAFIGVQLVHTHAKGTRIRVAEINLFLTALASKTIGTLTTEIVDQIGTVASKQTRLFKTVINVDLTSASLPSFRALAIESALRQSAAQGSVGTRVTILRAGILSDVTVLSFVTSSAEAFKVSWARQVLAHSSVRAGILIITVRLLLLALQARESFGTVATVALGQVYTGSIVVTGLRGALIHINLTILALEASWAIAFAAMEDRNAQATVHALLVLTVNVPAVVLAGGTGRQSLGAGLASEALSLPAKRLEVVWRAGGAGGQSGGAVIARGAALPTLVGVICTGLEGEHAVGTGLARLVAV